MPRKLVMPQPLSRKIGQLGLSRSLMIALLSRIHSEIVSHGNEFQPDRISGNERCFGFRMRLIEGKALHVFLLEIDDTTSPDHFIAVDIHHLLIES